MRSGALQAIARLLRRTPLHPQWLLGGNTATIAWIRAEAAGRVLDIGCADRWIQPNLPQGCDYIGLDYPATGKDLYEAAPDVFADASRLPLPDACVDTVIVLEVMEHLRHPMEALHEISRVLRPQGKVLLSIPFLYPIHDAPYDYQRLTRYGLVRDAEAAGLQIDAISNRLGSAESAGLIASLALAGMALESVKKHSPSMLLVPLILLAIPVVNLLARLCVMLLPSWEAVTNGYQLTASKP